VISGAESWAGDAEFENAKTVLIETVLELPNEIQTHDAADLLHMVEWVQSTGAARDSLANADDWRVRCSWYS
jgi:hypothetical protein